MSWLISVKRSRFLKYSLVMVAEVLVLSIRILFTRVDVKLCVLESTLINHHQLVTTIIPLIMTNCANLISIKYNVVLTYQKLSIPGNPWNYQENQWLLRICCSNCRIIPYFVCMIQFWIWNLNLMSIFTANKIWI